MDVLPAAEAGARVRALQSHELRILRARSGIAEAD
jgi:hypothetical protein